MFPAVLGPFLGILFWKAPRTSKRPFAEKDFVNVQLGS